MENGLVRAGGAPRSNKRRNALVPRVFAALAMVLGSVVALQSPAGAAPGNLKDIDVAQVDGSLYVVAGLTKGGTLQVQPMTCPEDSPTCGRQGWTTVGRDVAYAEIHKLSDRLLLVARLNNGRTLYKRGSCQGVKCVWYSWQSLGGKVVSVRASQDGWGCVSIAGLSAKRRVYKARVCETARDYGWTSLRGSLNQVAVDSSGSVFGVTSSNAFWWHDSGTGYQATWKSGGGRITQPVEDKTGGHSYCGLSSKRQMWCFDTWDYRWTNAGGYWRKLDDNQTIGAGGNWQFWAKDSSDDFRSYGGSVNQLAWDGALQVGVSGSLKPWYRFNDYYADNAWHPA